MALTADQFIAAFASTLDQVRAASTFPVPGLVKTFDPDLTAPVSLYNRTGNPGGLFKPNFWFGADGEEHDWNNVLSVWPDAASSRAGGLDMQTYADPAYDGVNPFASGPDGLTITAAKNPAPGDKTPAAYTSGLVTTQFSHVQRYGYFEARLSLPLVKGTFPAFWLLGAPDSEYAADEIDVIEGLGGTPGVAYINAHMPRTGWNAPSEQASFDPAQPVTAGLLWTPETLTWYVGGVQAASCPNPGFHHPMYLLVDLAMGPKSGGWAALNTPVDDAHLPASMTLHSLTAWQLPQFARL